MKSHTTAQFWKAYDRLPEGVQQHADEADRLWQKNPNHPSLQFKQVDLHDPIFSVRVGRGHRALGWLEKGTVTWFWIGGHGEYDRLLKR